MNRHGLFRLKVEFENDTIVDLHSKNPEDIDEGFLRAKQKLFGRK